MHEPISTGPDDTRELVVFVGRSNVGKSSIIRALTGKRVRVGKHPGSTRKFLALDMGPVIFIDMPGFGYMAKQSRTKIEETKTAIVRSLEKLQERIVLGVLILDVSLFREIVERWERRGEIPIDVEFYAFLHEVARQVIVVANKIDKVRRRDRGDVLSYVAQRLTEAMPTKQLNLVVTSASKKHGISELREAIEACLDSEGVGIPRWPGIEVDQSD